MSSNFILVGGFFFVERWISDDNFLSNRTWMEAEYINKDTLVSLIARWSMDFVGTGGGVGVTMRWVEVPEKEEKIEEKKPPPEVGGLMNVADLIGFIRFFSVPEV